MSKKLIALLVVFAVTVCLIPVLLGIGGAFFAFTSLTERAKTEQDGLALLRSLHGSNIVRIVVSGYVSRPLMTITNPSVLTSFADAVNRTERYRPNHPAYDQEFYVELFLQDGQRREYEFHTMHSNDEVIYIYFVHKKEWWTSYHGNGKSASLYVWMKEQELIE